MRIKLIASGAAIALAATIGAASADEQFNTLDGITAQAMNAQEMGVVVGMDNLAIDVSGLTGGTASPSPPTAQPVGRHNPGATSNGVRTFVTATGPGGNH